MKTRLFGMTLLMCLFILGSVTAVMAEDIDDIQWYNEDGTVYTGAGSYQGQTVTVTGTVVIPDGTYNSGTFYIQGATGGISAFSNGAGLANGQSITVTGMADEYSGEIQIAGPSIVDNGMVGEVTPTEMTIGAILGDYENVGNYVSSIGTVVSVGAAGSNYAMYMHSGTDTIQVYIDITCFPSFDTGAYPVGDQVKVISPVVNYRTEIELKPGGPAYIILNPGGDTLPVILDINASNWVPGANDAVTVSAEITDDNGVDSATLYYRDSDSVTPGSWMALPMSASGDTYSATIPAPHAMSQVDYYIAADDGVNDVVNYPASAPTSFVSIAVGITSIYTMQTPIDPEVSMDNSYNDRVLNIHGIVTAETGQVGDNTSRMMVQELLPNPADGTYAYGGILVYYGSGISDIYRGDTIKIGGTGGEYNNQSEIFPHNADAIVLVGFSDELPPASVCSTRELSDPVLGEAWESVWVKTFPSAVVDTLGMAQYGNYLLDSSTGTTASDSLVVDPFIDMIFQPVPGDVLTVEGYINLSYGVFELVPISDEYVIQTGLTLVDDTPSIVAAGGFQSIAPNPFNPTAEITFTLNRENLTQLNVYNIRGEKVRTLVQERRPVGTHTELFDGKDDSGSTLASGTYFARLRIGGEVTQVRKMTLIK